MSSPTPYFFDAFCRDLLGSRILRIERSRLEKQPASMADALGVIEVDGAKLYLKVYNTRLRGEYSLKLNYVVEANEFVIHRLLRRPVTTLGEAAARMLEKGMAAILLMCRGLLYKDGDAVEAVGLAAPYVGGAKSLQLIGYPHLSGRGDGLEDEYVRRVFCRVLEIAAGIQGINLVHGDIKPANILLLGDNPVLVDFDGLVPVEAYPPVFKFEPSGGDLPEFDDLTYDFDDPSTAMLLDWVGVVYTGAFIGSSSKTVVGALRRAGGGSLEDDHVKKALAEVLGDPFVGHLEVVLKSERPSVERPVISLYEDLKSSGVC